MELNTLFINTFTYLDVQITYLDLQIAYVEPSLEQ